MHVYLEQHPLPIVVISLLPRQQTGPRLFPPRPSDISSTSRSSFTVTSSSSSEQEAGRATVRCIHCGVEVTELSTNKQHTLSLCVFITAGPSTKLFAWGGGILEDMCYERRRAEACVD
jgi:hypothetical protein